MKKKGLLPAVLLLLGLSGAPGFALDIDPFPGFDDGRSGALGGPHVAVVDDFAAMFTNPSSLVATKPSVSLGRIDLKVAGPVFDIANIFLGGGDATAGVLQVLADQNYKLYTAVDLSGPLALGYMGEGLGFGIFMKTHALLDVASISSIKAEVYEDLVITGGYGLRVDLTHRNVLDFGVLAKGFVRGSMGLTGGIVDLSALLADPTSIINGDFTLTSGIGLDLGMRWDWANTISIGIACRDLFSPVLVSKYTSATAFLANSEAPTTTQGLVQPDLSAGFAIRPPLGIFGRVFDSILFTGDYDRFLDLFKPIARNAILNARVGLELRVLEVLTLRVGISEALLHAGVDFNLGFAHVNASAWGQELGYEPGARPVYNLLIGMDFVY
jgi:hypothetical protein